MKFTKHIAVLFTAVAATVLLAGCIREGGPGPDVVRSDEFFELNFEAAIDDGGDISLGEAGVTAAGADAVAPKITTRADGTVPALAVPDAETRAVSSDPATLLEWEEHVATIDILVFLQTGKYSDDGIYVCSVHGVDIYNGTAEGGTANNTVKFKAVLPKMVNGIDLTGKKISLVVLANLRDALNSYKAANTLEPGVTEFAGIVPLLSFKHETSWNTAPGSTQYLPMSAFAANVIVPDAFAEPILASANTGRPMTRSVAAFDIGFNYSGTTPAGFTGAGDDPVFKISRATMLNIAQAGRVAYYIKMTGTGAITLSYSPRILPNVSNSDYDYQLATPSATGMFGDIYVPETKLTNPDNTPNRADRTALIIGGYYTAPGAGAENTTDLSWYRVDLQNIFNMSVLIPGGSTGTGSGGIIQNIRYTVRINDIAGPGYLDKDEAINGEPNLWANLSVVPWNRSDHQAVIDGPYTFEVSQDELFFDDYAARTLTSTDNTITRVWTDYADGWKVDGFSNDGTDPSQGTAGDWLSTDITAGSTCTESQLRVITTTNTTTNDRTGYIHLSAGRWKYTVKVRQELNL